MKLSIKVGDMQLEYQDDYSMLEEPVKNRIESILRTIYSAQPTLIASTPVIGTVDEIFCKTKQHDSSR